MSNILGEKAQSPKNEVKTADWQSLLKTFGLIGLFGGVIIILCLVFLLNL